MPASPASPASPALALRRSPAASCPSLRPWHAIHQSATRGRSARPGSTLSRSLALALRPHHKERHVSPGVEKDGPPTSHLTSDSEVMINNHTRPVQPSCCGWGNQITQVSRKHLSSLRVPTGHDWIISLFTSSVTPITFALFVHLTCVIILFSTVALFCTQL